jgi:membrane-bound hydrogenase subunit beta
MSEKPLTAEQIVQSFQEKFDKHIIEHRIERHLIGPKKNAMIHIWLKIDKSILRHVVQHLITLEPYPHFAVASGYDLGASIELVYHFMIYYGNKAQEILINFTVPIAKKDPTVDSICDLIPGALISEQEKQEMLGIKVHNIPKDARVFVSDDFPEDMYPWRRDEKGPGPMVRNLHEPLSPQLSKEEKRTILAKKDRIKKEKSKGGEKE